MFRTVLAVAAIAGSVVLTRAQLVHWRDAVSLWEHTVRARPEHARARAYMGVGYTRAPS